MERSDGQALEQLLPPALRRIRWADADMDELHLDFAGIWERDHDRFEPGKRRRRYCRRWRSPGAIRRHAAKRGRDFLHERVRTERADGNHGHAACLVIAFVKPPDF